MGATAQSLAVHKNNATITSATMTVTVDSGSANLTYYLSPDAGSTFEEVTSGTSHTFTASGTELRWKIVASGAAVVSGISIQVVDA